MNVAVTVTAKIWRRACVKLLLPPKPPTWAFGLLHQKQHLDRAPERERRPVLFWCAPWRGSEERLGSALLFLLPSGFRWFRTGRVRKRLL